MERINSPYLKIKLDLCVFQERYSPQRRLNLSVTYEHKFKVTI